jgi:hypothetical protein
MSKLYRLHIHFRIWIVVQEAVLRKLEVSLRLPSQKGSYLTVPDTPTRTELPPPYVFRNKNASVLVGCAYQLTAPPFLSIVLWEWYVDDDGFLKTRKVAVVHYFKVLYVHLPTGTGDSRSRGSNPGPTEYEAGVNNQYTATYSHNLLLIIKIQNWSRFTHSRVSRVQCSLFQFS